VICGLLRAQAGRIAEENRRRSPGDIGVHLGLQCGSEHLAGAFADELVD
jgi:hypothetical protein